jgi:hypothetical protein
MRRSRGPSKTGSFTGIAIIVKNVYTYGQITTGSWGPAGAGVNGDSNAVSFFQYSAL